VVVAAVVAVALAACGIPPEKRATLAQPEDVPFDLLGPPPDTATTSTTVPAERRDTVQVYLAQGERLVAVPRKVPAPATPEVILGVLVAGPTDVELSQGISTAILGEDVIFVRSVGVTGGIATVDLGPTFSDVPNKILALGQIVFTLTGLPGIGRVSFTRDGAPTAVPRSNGEVTTDSVSKDDYSLVAPPAR
jgi:spore germination protein GerM